MAQKLQAYIVYPSFVWCGLSMIGHFQTRLPRVARQRFKVFSSHSFQVKTPSLKFARVWIFNLRAYGCERACVYNFSLLTINFHYYYYYYYYYYFIAYDHDQNTHVLITIPHNERRACPLISCPHSCPSDSLMRASSGVAGSRLSVTIAPSSNTLIFSSLVSKHETWPLITAAESRSEIWRPRP